MKNLKKVMFAIAIIGLFAFLQSCKSDNDSDYQMDNQTFVNQASSSNNFEIAAGMLATTNSSNTLVQQYGSRMVSEHTTVGNDLKSIATSKNLNVPTALQAKEQTNLTALTALSGSQFDAQFVNMMIVSHQDAIALFQNASGSKGVRDGDLRNFAANKLPSLKAHLQEAQTLQTQVQTAP
jgi:putative membrane protein